MTPLDVATVPDLLRLLAVPVFGLAAVRDVRTRRISSSLWIPLALLGGVLLLWDALVARAAGPAVWQSEFLVPAAISLGFVVPFAYLCWWFGAFGGADGKALLVLALLFPTTPQYVLGSWTIPVAASPVGAFSFVILTNAVVVALAIPIALAVRNVAAGRLTRLAFVGRPVPWERVPMAHGKLLSAPSEDGGGGLDLDALRMYLRWRGLTLARLREQPDRFRDPATLPDEPNPPTDGAVADGPVGDAGPALEDLVRDGGDRSSEYDDPWGAEAFLEDIEGTAYGTSPAELRAGLETLVTRDRIWISPGMPFLVPLFLGLVAALTYGDVLLGPLL
ncbi:peptidase A24A prepilin type IV [Natronococcus amylolyticus DSM 10524]|uniref:Peptidase A24A prepilin type IV n=1 Tax=Natronococcus amylolyticus DSM 10524 TaxID=1227497 RepID=L9XDH4_9EURY|nr:A24 family peptidase [Natronococcus amylolyticus]ELY59486.1 peptidase A24A prepilin type IV [Natronococcus amylolyticus DSM 10524]